MRLLRERASALRQPLSEQDSGSARLTSCHFTVQAQRHNISAEAALACQHCRLLSVGNKTLQEAGTTRQAKHRGQYASVKVDRRRSAPKLDLRWFIAIMAAMEDCLAYLNVSHGIHS